MRTPQHGWTDDEPIPNDYDRREQALLQQILSDPVLCAQTERMTDTQWGHYVQGLIKTPVLRQVYRNGKDEERRKEYYQGYARRRYTESKH